MIHIEKSGTRYGRLVVLYDIGMQKTKCGKKRHFVLCKCDCGNIKEINLFDLKNKKITSCGCYKKEKNRESGVALSQKRNGNPKHNLCYTLQYRIYHQIKGKLYNKNNKKYNLCGGAGIKMCDEWLNDFKSFYKWTVNNGFSDKKCSIKRKDPNGDYCPENCVVCSKKEAKYNIWSDKSFNEMSKNIKKWYNENKDFVEENMIPRILKTKLKKYGTLATNARENCSWKAGWREIGGKRKYFRSKWEANYARYLEWLKEHNQIKEWQHENKTFWFEGIKRGCRSYLPDFEVENNNGTIEYHEVKGWYDDRSKTKVKRMAKYYPEVKLIIIFQKQYNEIKNKVGRLINGWE